LVWARWIADHDQLLRLSDGKHLQQQAVHDGENGSVCSDAERESNNGYGCEAWALAQLA
jgi:hypothetical protein